MCKTKLPSSRSQEPVRRSPGALFLRFSDYEQYCTLQGSWTADRHSSFTMTRYYASTITRPSIKNVLQNAHDRQIGTRTTMLSKWRWRAPGTCLSCFCLKVLCYGTCHYYLYLSVPATNYSLCQGLPWLSPQ